MSSMKKRIPMFLLALAMMVAMALPTFADSPSVYSSLGDSVSSVQNTYYQLNAATEGTPVAGTLLTMWHNTGSNTQRWDIVTCPGTAYYWFQNAANKSVVISYNGNTQARLAAKNTSTYGIQTQGTKSVTEGNTSEGFVKHGLVLPTYVLCLTASQCSDGSQAQWLASNGKSNQLWIYAKYY